MTEDADVQEILARLQRLEDKDEIRRLYVDYGRHLDAGDFEAYAGLFARDAKLRLGPVLRADGREEIFRVAEANLRPAHGGQGSVHVLGSPRIDLDGDRASGECVWSAVSMTDDGSSRVLVGRHVDELVREDGRWRLASRKGLIDVGALG
jgi:uncharacterized protein (TIGR02246 family)